MRKTLPHGSGATLQHKLPTLAPKPVDEILKVRGIMLKLLRDRLEWLSGGAVSLATGYGSATASGAFSIRSAKAGQNEVSGILHFSTGDSTSGNTGATLVRTGAGAKGMAVVLASSQV